MKNEHKKTTFWQVIKENIQVIVFGLTLASVIIGTINYIFTGAMQPYDQRLAIIEKAQAINIESHASLLTKEQFIEAIKPIQSDIKLIKTVLIK